jgi:RNA polymerase sigma-70 factor (ECF subfamily)
MEGLRSAADEVDPVATFVAMAYAEHAAVVERVVFASTRDPEGAADAAQEAFIRLLREARANRYPDHPRAWLVRTALNATVSGARRRSTARRLAPRLVDTRVADGPDEVVLAREAAHEVEQLLATLSAPQRTALVLAAQGVAGADIAARLGRSPEATRSLMFRARTRIRHVAAAQHATA